MDARSVFLDTNILLTAVTPFRPLYSAAVTVLNDWPANGRELFASGQVLREWLVVATRPIEVNGLGLSLEDALHDISAFRSRLILLEETESVATRLVELVAKYASVGKQIHDTNILATALTYEVESILTCNAADFRRYAPEIEILDLAEVLTR